MSILKADILRFVNGRLNVTETDIDEEIILVLDDLSDAHILKAQDTSQELTATDLSMPYPTYALDDDQAIISVTLTDQHNSEQIWPLEVIPGGWTEYKRLMTAFNTAGRSEPTHYICNNRVIYPYPPPQEPYDVDIWYWKRHPADADSIVFPDSFRRAIYFGASYEVACKRKLIDYITIWMNRYEKEKEKRRIMLQ